MSHFEADPLLGPLAWEQTQRFRLLELVLFWEGNLNTHHLCRAFNIGRQQASRDIQRYIRQVSPLGLDYDRIKKSYKATPQFTPYFSSCTLDEYLGLLKGTLSGSELAERSHRLPVVDFGHGHTTTLDVPARHIAPEIIRGLVKAARQQLRVDVDYVSLGSGEQVGRNIVPHTLVFDGIRWHVRAWCEKKKKYLDFVMSRFRGSPDLLDASQHGMSADSEWHCWLTAIVIPNPFLSATQQAIIADDYAMTNGKLSITQRLPLLHYILERVRVNYLGGFEQQPLQYPLVLANRDELIALGANFRLDNHE